MSIENHRMYFATGVDALAGNLPIDPEYPGAKIYEFGSGFYLADKKSTAKSYAKLSLIQKINNVLLQKRQNNERIDINKVCRDAKVYLFTFYVDFGTLEDYSHLFISSRDIYAWKETLTDVLDRYKNYPQYNPAVTWTYGPLCGRSWDSDITFTSSLADIESCMTDCMDDNQLCIHKRILSTEEGTTHYLKHLSCISMEVLTITDFQKEGINTDEPFESWTSRQDADEEVRHDS